NDNDYTESAIAFLGGGLLVWLLWRGFGKGNGFGFGNTGGAGDRKTDVDRELRPLTGAPVEQDPYYPMVVLRKGDKIDLDGRPSDLATVIARARVAGHVDLMTKACTSTRWHDQVYGALAKAGVRVSTIRIELIAGLPKDNQIELDGKPSDLATTIARA